MSEGQKITINPVTRIEGHAKITLQLDDQGKVKDARFHVNEFRGFEKFCEGRYYTEMPNIAPRICGICPVSHAVASAKACERIQGVTPPLTGTLLRRLMHLGQFVSSHALSFFHLSAPDFLLGWDSDPSRRNILGLAEKYPDVARKGIRLRKFGQELSERIAGRKIHSSGIRAGGVLRPLPQESRQALLASIPEAVDAVRTGLDLFKAYRDQHRDEFDTFANFETLYLGTVGPRGELEFYDGKLRFMDAGGAIIADQLDPQDYLAFIAERPIDWSYLKYPYFKALGFPQGVYRVGPLARLNVASSVPTPLAREEFARFKDLGGGRPVQGSLHFHHARLVEMLAAIEQIQEILEDDRVIDLQVCADAKQSRVEGIGCTEAPRGTLFHHYSTDEHGILTSVNLLIATGQNNPSMNRSILEVARQYVDGANVREGAFNRVEAAIRCYDPCLSCSTHAIGTMPLRVEILNEAGTVLNVLQR